MLVQPYLFFGGRCDEALAFYREALDADVDTLLRFKDNPEPCEDQQLPPDWDEKVMHASFRIGDTVVMASDGCGSAEQTPQGFSLSITVADAAEADRVFAALGDGGQVQMPLMQTFFSPRFGMVTDPFGVSWMVYVAP